MPFHIIIQSFVSQLYSVTMFECDLCNQTFEKERDLKSHTTKKHVKTNYKCDLCNRSFGYLKNLMIHKKNHQDDPIVKEKVKYSYSHSCSDCSFTEQRKHLLSDHFKTTHLNIKFSCDVCDYQTNSRSGMHAHKISIHMQTRYPCELCDYQATASSNLRNHIMRIYDCINVINVSLVPNLEII